MILLDHAPDESVHLHDLNPPEDYKPFGKDPGRSKCSPAAMIRNRNNHRIHGSNAARLPCPRPPFAEVHVEMICPKSAWGLHAEMLDTRYKYESMINIANDSDSHM